MPTSAADLLAAAYSDADRTIDLRRRLHRRPEIGLHLPQTQATVVEAFEGLPIEVTTGFGAVVSRRTDSGITTLRPWSTSVIR